MSKKYRKVNQPNHRKISPKPLTLLDIIIPIYNRFDLLEKCVKAIPEAVGTNIPYRVFLVDNASDDEKANAFYGMLSSDFRIIRNKENIGFPKACNMGVRAGSSPLIFLLNSDVILEPNSLDILVRAMDDPEVGVAGMKLIFPSIEQYMEAGLQSTATFRPAGKLQHAGLSSDIRGKLFHHFLGWNPDHPKVNAIRDVLAVTGAAFMTRRKIWEALKGFDEMYGMGTYEDIDFCLSVRLLGGKIIVETKAVGLHYVGATAEGNKISYSLQENELKFLSKWAGKYPWTEHEVL
jgi:GT2 family glycosyltransferase